MNKAEFLKDLENKLDILNKSEREDILSEYEQHIEMRMKGGLTEEEAIKDFGNLEELVKEILEAYNVNPEYGKGKRFFGGRKTGEGAVKNAAQGGKKATEILEKGWKKALGFLACLGKKACSCIKAVFALCFGVVTVPWKVIKSRRKKGERENLETEELSEAAACAGGRGDRRNSIWGKLSHLFLWCCLLGVKCAVIFCMWPVALCEIIGIICFGALIVFLIMGYPVAGLTIITIGCLMCGGAALWLTKEILFISLKKNCREDGEDEREEREDGEAPAEREACKA